MKFNKSLLLFPDAADGGNATGAAVSGSGDSGNTGTGAGTNAGAAAGGGTVGQATTATPISTAQKLWGGLVDSTDKTKTQGQQTDKTKGGQSNDQNTQGGQGVVPKNTTQGQAAGQTLVGQQGQGTDATTQSGQGQQQPQDQPKNINLTEEMLANLGKKIAESVNPPQQQQQQQMTQEEFDKTFNIYKPTPETWRAIRGEDEGQAIEAMTSMLHGAAKQATTIASYLLNHEIQQLKDFIQPAIQMAQEKQLEAMKTEFFEKNQDLKGLDPLLVLIRDQFVAKGTKFNTKDEAFKAVAEEARRQIEAIPGLKAASAANLAAAGQTQAQAGQGQSTQQGQQQQTSQQTARKMPALSGGQGQRGAGDTGAASGSGAKSTAERIFS